MCVCVMAGPSDELRCVWGGNGAPFKKAKKSPSGHISHSGGCSMSLYDVRNERPSEGPKFHPTESHQLHP